MGQLAAVVGLGKSGEAAALLLHHLGWQVEVWDSRQGEELCLRTTLLIQKGITVYLGKIFMPRVELHKVVVSPGVPWDSSFLEEARQLGLQVQGEVDLAWESLKVCPWVGITGTNGKTTTTALIEAIWQGNGWHAPACGNIGRPIGQVALEPAPDWVIAELSSFQIEQSPQIAPRIAAWTTFTPDHLNRHGTVEHYSAIKQSLLDRAETIVINGDDPHLMQLRDRWQQGLWTSTHDVSAPVHIHRGQIWCQGEVVLPVTELQIPGVHNQQNILVAVACAHLAGIPHRVIAQAVRNFRGVSHRLEKIGVKHGITFINDSKATNYDASIVGLAAMDQPVILLAGGQLKEGDPQPWLEMIATKTLRVVLYGSAAPKFAQLLTDSGYNAFQVCLTLDEAVALAWEKALTNSIKIILLSPACASYDQFANFEERGQRFRQAFDQLHP